MKRIGVTVKVWAEEDELRVCVHVGKRQRVGRQTSDEVGIRPHDVAVRIEQVVLKVNRVAQM